MPFTKQLVDQMVEEIMHKEWNVRPDKIGDDTYLEEALGFDSIDRVKLAVVFEEAFGIVMPETVAEISITRGHFKDYIIHQLKEQLAYQEV